MAGKGRSFRTNRYAANLLASFAVIFTGLAACLAMAMVDVRGTDHRPVLAVIALFTLLAMFVVVLYRPWSGASVSPPTVSGGLWSRLRRRLMRPSNQTAEIKPWKRRRTALRSEPHGAEYVSVFVRDRGEEPSPPLPPRR